MLLGYARVSKADGSQLLDLQLDALREAGVADDRVYADRMSGRHDHRPGLDACLKALRPGDTLCVWKLDRLGRNLRHLVTLVDALQERGVGLRVLAGHGAAVDTTRADGRLIFAVFVALAEFERESVIERIKAGLIAARVRGRAGKRPFKMTPAEVRLAMAAMGQPETKVGDRCREFGVTRQTLYRHTGPTGACSKTGAADRAAGTMRSAITVLTTALSSAETISARDMAARPLTAK
jgi:DNA invertase Pin-like site-specific DNA recombinase